MPLPVTLIWSSHLSNFSQAHSLKHSPLCFTFTIAGLTHPQRLRYWSSMSPTHQPSQAVNQPQTHTAIRLRPTGKAMRSKPRERCSVIRNQSISEDVDSVGSINAWVCLRLVILFGLDWGKRLRIWFFFFFFLLWTGGGGGGGGCLCCVGCGLLCLATKKL